MVEIVVDSREPRDIRRLLDEHPAVEIRCERLDVGDYLIGPDAVVERKTAGDFASSIVDGRLAEQAAQLTACYSRIFWLIQGDPLVAHDGIDPRSLMGAVSYLAVEARASLARTDTVEQTVELIVALARRLQDGGGSEPGLRPSKPKDPALMAEFIVGGLPGVGRAKARMLLAHFGSVDAVFRASSADIAALPGFGRKSAALIRAAVEARYAP